jgi:hypothetical protein
MSIPIVICRFKRALTNDEDFYALMKDLKYNRNFGSLSIWPCKHEPKCPLLTNEEWIQLIGKIKKYETNSNNR